MRKEKQKSSEPAPYLQSHPPFRARAWNTLEPSHSHQTQWVTGLKTDHWAGLVHTAALAVLFVIPKRAHPYLPSPCPHRCPDGGLPLMASAVPVTCDCGLNISFSFSLSRPSLHHARKYVMAPGCLEKKGRSVWYGLRSWAGGWLSGLICSSSLTSSPPLSPTPPGHWCPPAPWTPRGSGPGMELPALHPGRVSIALLGPSSMPSPFCICSLCTEHLVHRILTVFLTFHRSMCFVSVPPVKRFPLSPLHLVNFITHYRCSANTS